MMDAETVMEIVANPKSQNCHPISSLEAWRNPDADVEVVEESDRQINLDEDGRIESFVDPRMQMAHPVFVGVRTSDVGEDGTADFTIFCGWIREEKIGGRSGRAMKPTKERTTERVNATWGEIFLDTEIECNGIEKFRDHVRSQIDYCANLDGYTEFNTRSIGRKVTDGSSFDDITVEWVSDKL